ncbi:hypothetical protein EST38_g2621 [Candolleomyces aberdarensis]|uniref:AAA+ ATPase domain-containing protein n=1 Tax=Candolleomyces aberdarensis TaxID=2316362 RepID=A0A4Q2DT09_9AGAR|nr:hypothetical protein EST38_g2621 [Candolleomyces aberdarensis]
MLSSVLEKLRKPGNTYLTNSQANKDDIVILIMGPTGAGKSTFVNNILHENTPRGNRAAVSDSFQLCTADVAQYFVTIPERLAKKYRTGHRQLIIVDTPGFGDPNVRDSDILHSIATCLASSCHAGTRVGGVIYVYPIYPDRMTGDDRSNLKALQQKCGETALSKVVLATTRWNICPPEAGDKRESEIRSAFVRDTIVPSEDEVVLVRLEDKRSSAWDVIEKILREWSRPPSPNPLDETGTTSQPFNIDRFEWKKCDDVCMSRREASATDLVVVVMGSVGHGKSTYINNVLQSLGRPGAAEVSDSFISGTTKVAHYIAQSPFNSPVLPKDRRLVLVDTPGFGHTELSEVEIARRIAVWLSSLYGELGMKLCGIVYIHSIGQGRITPGDLSAFEVFRRLCGMQAFVGVYLATTKWDLCTEEVGQRREKELKAQLRSGMADGQSHPLGAAMVRLKNTPQSALELVETIVVPPREMVLLIQKQIVDMRMPFEKTDAGRFPKPVNGLFAKWRGLYL